MRHPASLLLGCLVGWGAALARTAPLDAPAIDASRPGNLHQALSIEQRETIESAPATLGAREYVVPFTYSCTVSRTGQVAALKFRNPDYGPRRREDPKSLDQYMGDLRDETRYLYGSVFLLAEWAGLRWDELQLSGPRIWSRWERPRLVVGPAGELNVVWVEWDVPEVSPWSRLVTKRRMSQGRWSATQALTDPLTRAIDSFNAVASRSSGLDLVWADDRSLHHPGEADQAGARNRVYARSWSENRDGDVVQISSASGGYSAYLASAHPGPDDVLFAVWDQMSSNGVFQLHLSNRAGGHWSAPIRVTDDKMEKSSKGTDGETGRLPNQHFNFDVAPLSPAKAAIVWARPVTEDIAYRIVDAGSLGPISVAASHAQSMNVAGSPDGAVHLLYEEFDPYAHMNQYKRPSSFHKRHIYYQCLKDGRWSDRQELADNAFAGTAGLSLDEAGKVHLFWQEFKDGVANLLHVTASSACGSPPADHIAFLPGPRAAP
jgi:hypothetical protein